MHLSVEIEILNTYYSVQESFKLQSTGNFSGTFIWNKQLYRVGRSLEDFVVKARCLKLNLARVSERSVTSVSIQIALIHASMVSNTWNLFLTGHMLMSSVYFVLRLL